MLQTTTTRKRTPQTNPVTEQKKAGQGNGEKRTEQ